jgi:type VI secretion system protein ImpL
MPYYGYYLTSTIFLIVYMVLAYFITGVLHLNGAAEMAVRSIVMALGVTVYGFIMFRLAERSRRKQEMAAGGGAAAYATPGGEVEIDVLFQQAQARLASSRLGRDVKLRNLPVFFVLGETGAAKSSIFVNSGVEPDLLAGQVYQDKSIIPTRPANLWLAQRSVFIEAGGGLANNPDRWVHLIKRLQPPRLKALFQRKSQAPRAAIVCVECDTFLRAGADDALSATARKINARLGEISQTLGIQLPVYVLFTKLDRLSCFLEFVGNLNDDEVNQVVGATLPMRATSQNGVYAEEEAKRLTTTFNDLFFGLCDKRPTFLLRERDDSKLPKVYEFPREFRKLRNSLVRFLVDLGKPSQLRLNPFLRGFYFSGVRPKVVNEAVPVRGSSENIARSMEQDASGIFELNADMPSGERKSAQGPVASVRARQVPQWLFLGHLFGSVILQDRVAMGASGSSAGAERMRRILLVAGALLGLTLLTGLTVSWMKNHELESNIRAAAAEIQQTRLTGSYKELASTESLRHLDRLLGYVRQLSDWNHNGAPWSYRWGLYVGDEIYDSVFRLYFARFDQLLLHSTQDGFAEYQEKLNPNEPKTLTNEQTAKLYPYTYNTLKAYLLTNLDDKLKLQAKSETPKFESEEEDFLPPLLLERWSANRSVDDERGAIAKRQFDFYAHQLLNYGNPLPIRRDDGAIARARDYLAQFGDLDRSYNAFLTELSKPPRATVSFNKRFDPSVRYVRSKYDVPGAFTKEGWLARQEVAKDKKLSLGGERWVLGDAAFRNRGTQDLTSEILKRYSQEYLGNWRRYLHDANVVPYGGPGDAASKLKNFSSGEASLQMKFFCLLTENVSVVDKDLIAPYQPVIEVLQRPGCMNASAPTAAQQYMKALGDLQIPMERVASNPLDADAARQTHAAADAAHSVVTSIASGFSPDSEGSASPYGSVGENTRRLLNEPIDYADRAVGNPQLTELNNGGKHVCDEFARNLKDKYPFNVSKNAVDASLNEVRHFFHPGDGTLYAFYDSSIKNLVDRNGDVFTAKPGIGMGLNPRFLTFLGHAIGFSESLYHGGSQEPQLHYVLQALPAEGFQTVTLTIDGQSLEGTASQGSQPKEFVWPAAKESDQSELLIVNMGTPLRLIPQKGLWAAFRFFGLTDAFDDRGNGRYNLIWIPKAGNEDQPIEISENHPLKLPFFLDLKGTPPVFRKGYLAIPCDPLVATKH